MAFWPFGETTQSMNFWPSACLTWACLAGLTRITPYWLNSFVSPSTMMPRSPRFLNDSQVPRSARM
jgi:hypothetical protein